MDVRHSISRMFEMNLKAERPIRRTRDIQGRATIGGISITGRQHHVGLCVLRHCLAIWHYLLVTRSSSEDSPKDLRQIVCPDPTPPLAQNVNFA